MSVKVLEGDCLATLRTLPDGIAQTCVTSPPYYGLRAYLPDGHPDKAAEVGAEDTPDAYVARLVAVFREVKRVLRDDGTLWLNLGDSYAGGKTGRTDQDRNTRNTDGRDPTNASLTGVPTSTQRPVPAGYKQKDLLGIPWEVAFALRADGWFLRSAIVWAKPNPMPESTRDRCTSAYEMVFMLAKRPRYYFDADAIAEPAEGRDDEPRAAMTASGISSPQLSGRGGFGGATRNCRNVWTIATQPYSGSHFAVMPVDLAERCIKAGSSERGQCPHCSAPWVRVVERTFDHEGAAEIAARRDIKHAAERNDHAYSQLSGTEKARLTSVTHGGWAPSCACPEHTPIPQTVLDPFGGAGTTALCADRLNRHAILCELNPNYAAIARDRLTADAPLFAVVA